MHVFADECEALQQLAAQAVEASNAAGGGCAVLAPRVVSAVAVQLRVLGHGLRFLQSSRREGDPPAVLVRERERERVRAGARVCV
jgi:hypothetical protein